jgi:hypothetical protein
MSVDTALQEIRALTSPEDQREALSGYLTGRPAREIIVQQLGSPLMAFAKQVELPAIRWRAALCGAAAAGAGEAALTVAASFKENRREVSPEIQTAVIQAWALSDLPSLCRFSESRADVPQRDMLAKGFGPVLPFLPVPAQLDPDHTIPSSLLTLTPAMHWQFLGCEAREAGFRFLERHATEPEYREEVWLFAKGAARYEPARAMALRHLADEAEKATK